MVFSSSHFLRENIPIHSYGNWYGIECNLRPEKDVDDVFTKLQFTKTVRVRLYM